MEIIVSPQFGKYCLVPLMSGNIFPNWGETISNSDLKAVVPFLAVYGLKYTMNSSWQQSDVIIIIIIM